MKLLNLEMNEKTQDSKKEKNSIFDNKDNNKKGDIFIKKQNIENRDSEASNNTEKTVSSMDSIKEFENFFSEMELNNNESKKEEINKDNLKENPQKKLDNKGNNTKNILPLDEFIIKDIEKDGNCFYRTLSYYYRETEQDYREFRELIVRYIENHPEEYIFAVPDDDIVITAQDDELSINAKKKEYILNYVNYAYRDGTYAGDLEITTACILFNCDIKMYVLVNNGYKLFNDFKPAENENENLEFINILFINNNHFCLLLSKDSSLCVNQKLIDKKVELKDIEKIVLENKIHHNLIINPNIDIKLKKKEYISYPKKGLEDYYNEIYRYLINPKIMPPRLQYSKNKKRKTQEKRRTRFRKLIKNKYRIINERLQYFYKYNKSELWVNIIYKDEKLSLLNYKHFSNNHLKRESMDLKILEMGFYWYGYSNDITQFIKECGVCHSENVIEKVPIIPKIILSKGPHIRYQADIWYLPEKLKDNNDYLYCLDIIDHFSKWMCSYMLKNKTAELILAKIKAFLRANGNCEIFQTDNGKEFNNQLLKIYLENNHIKYLRSAPYHPQSNGCCEAVHKEIKNYLLVLKEKQKEKFDLDIAIEEAIDYHNNRKMKSTGYKPADIKDTSNEDVIKEVVENIIKSMRRKVKFDQKALKNTLLLICPEIEMISNIYNLKKKKSKKNFIIPAILIKYVNNNTISIKIKIDFQNGIKFKINDIININIECCRIIDDFGFTYYLNLNGQNLNFEDVKKFALLED